MDTTDAALVRFFASGEAWNWDIRASMAAAARHTGLSRDAARQRMQRLQDRGIILGWDVAVNPGLLGTEMTRFEFDCPEGPEKARLMAQLAALEGARILFDYHDGGLAGLYYTAPEHRRRWLALLESLAGAAPRVIPVHMPAPTIKPTPATWRLIQVLRGGARAPLADIAADLGVSTKTARRRIEALQQGRGAFLTLGTDFSRFDKGIIVEAKIAADDPAEVRRRIEAWPGITYLNQGGPVVVASLVVETPLDVTRTRQALAAMPGVTWSACHILQQRLLLHDWLDAQIEQRIAAAQA